MTPFIIRNKRKSNKRKKEKKKAKPVTSISTPLRPPHATLIQS